MTLSCCIYSIHSWFFRRNSLLVPLNKRGAHIQGVLPTPINRFVAAVAVAKLPYYRFAMLYQSLSILDLEKWGCGRLDIKLTTT